MSLETGGYIKDLVASNPPGTDPKSQGDDHLRLIKLALKQQFSGFTQGAPITRTESQINSALLPGQFGLGGLAAGFNDPNFAIGTNASGFYFFAGGTDNLPPNAAIGDTMLQIVTNGNLVTQLWMSVVSNMVWYRKWQAGAWSNWAAVSGIGVGQAWQNLAASRALNTAYTNTTSRPIMVSVTGIGAAGAAAASIEAWCGGVVVGRAQVTDNNGAAFVASQATLSFIVPNATAYQVNSVGAAVTVGTWAELRG